MAKIVTNSEVAKSMSKSGEVFRELGEGGGRNSIPPTNDVLIHDILTGALREGVSK